MLRSLLSFATNSTPDYIFPAVNPEVDGKDCFEDCSNCTIQCPAKLKIETSLPLYGHVKEFHTHVLVATGKTDWLERVEDEKGSLMEAFKFGAAKSKGGRIMVSASNFIPPKGEDILGDKAGKTTVLLLPSFIFVDDVSPVDIKDLIDTYIDIPQTLPRAENMPMHSRLSARPCLYDYVILLCSHRRRDARCGITAPLIRTEFERHLRQHGIYRDLGDERKGGVGIFFVSHVGGHKFAANVLIYRREEQQMIWLARVKPEHCEGIVKYTVLQGKVVHPESQLKGGFDRKRGVTSW